MLCEGFVISPSPWYATSSDPVSNAWWLRLAEVNTEKKTGNLNRVRLHEKRISYTVVSKIGTERTTRANSRRITKHAVAACLTIWS